MYVELRQPDRQRMNDLCRKIYLMMLGYLSSLTYSVFIRLLTLSLHHPSLTHYFLRPLATSLVFVLRFAFSLSHTLTLPLSPSPQTVTLCIIRSRCWQLREIKCNMARVWGGKKTALIVKQIVVMAKACFFLLTLNAGNVTQSSVWAGYFLWSGYCYTSVATGYCLSCVC